MLSWTLRVNKADYGSAPVMLVFCKGETLLALLGGFTLMPVIGACAKGFAFSWGPGIPWPWFDNDVALDWFDDDPPVCLLLWATTTPKWPIEKIKIAIVVNMIEIRR